MTTVCIGPPVGLVEGRFKLSEHWAPGLQNPFTAKGCRPGLSTSRTIRGTGLPVGFSGLATLTMLVAARLTFGVFVIVVGTGLAPVLTTVTGALAGPAGVGVLVKRLRAPASTPIHTASKRIFVNFVM